jgi:hypothetical protein
MPRTHNSINSSYYHYIVHTLSTDGETILSSKYHKTQKEITAEYQLNRSAIYYLLNPVENRVPRITRNYKIEKVMIPIYQTTMIQPEVPQPQITISS